MLRRLGIRARLVVAAVLTLLVAGIALERLSAGELSAALAAEGAPRAAIEAAVGHSRRLVLLGVAVAAGVAVAVGAAATSFIAHPVRDLTRFALAISKGDLSLRAPAQGTREVAQLARALNHLTDELSHSIGALRAERDVLTGVLEGMREGVLVLDCEGRIVLANRALREMTAVGDDAIGRSAIEAFRSAALAEAIELARRRSEPVDAEVELGRSSAVGRTPAFRFPAASGARGSGLAVPSPRRVLVRISRLQGDGKRGTVAVLHDVTDLRRLETIRTDFVANVSHELRTPITAISTAAETLLLGALKDPDEAAEFVDMIDRHGRRLRQLVDDLLDLSKIEAQSLRLALEDLAVAPVIAHAAHLLAEPARRRAVAVSVDQGGDLLHARFDRRALEQVLMNLLDNAIKYAGEGARVTVTSRAEGDHVAIAVSDDGPGIPPQHLGRLFERFYRVDAGRSRDLGGTGLGLSIVKHLVELMHGSIEVESALGRGTTFTVRLPREA